jgi:hypothetical protein
MGDPKLDAVITAALANSEEDPRLVRLPGEEGWYATVVGLRLLPYTPGQKAITVLAKVSQDFERFDFGLSNVIFATTALVDEVADTVTFLVGCNDIAVGRVAIPLSDIFNSMN